MSVRRRNLPMQREIRSLKTATISSHCFCVSLGTEKVPQCRHKKAVYFLSFPSGEESVAPLVPLRTCEFLFEFLFPSSLPPTRFTASFSLALRFRIQ